MRFFPLILVLLCAFDVVAWARSKQAPPLILTPINTVADSRQVSYSVEDSRVVKTTGRSSRGSSSMRWGLDIGLLGRYNATNADAFGLKMMWGGRFGARWSLGGGFYLKPTIGYFRRVEGAGDASVAQNLFELGAVAQYSIVRIGNLSLLGGGTLRGEAQFSRISALGVSDMTAIAYGGRAGPAVSANLPLNRSTSLVFDWEVTFGFERPLRTYSGLTGGVLFSLD